MFTSIAFLVLSQTSITHQSISFEELKEHEISDGVFPLHAPHLFRSVGFWSNGNLNGAEVALFDTSGQTENWWPLEFVNDLNHLPINPNGIANGAKVSALIHGSHVKQNKILLRIPEQSPYQLSVMWISGQYTPTKRQTGTNGNSSRTSNTKPPVYERLSWSADPPVCTPSYCDTTHIAMHHTASASEFNSQSWAECAANVKATQVYHMATRGWCDIGYNYLICPHGDIFEGRDGGDNVRGAHDGFNCGSMGVSMMGYFHAPYNHTLTDEMKDSFVSLSAWKCEQQAIDPLGSDWYAGFGGFKENLYGHRDVKATSCPGDHAYATMPELRQRVSNLVKGEVIILDNEDASFIGNWSLGTTSLDKYGLDYRWASTGVAPAQAVWNPIIPTPGTYQISMWWPDGSNRYQDTLAGLRINGRLLTTKLNQQLNGGQWNILGDVQLQQGAVPIGISNQGVLGWVVMADALRLVKQ